MAKLQVYESIASADKYYGLSPDQAQTKDIDGEKFIEVVSSLSHPKPTWIKLSSLRKVDTVYVPQ